MSPTSVRDLREHLSATMARVARGEEVLVTHRGQPYVRIVPASRAAAGASRHPLKGSVLYMADDFDAPVSGLWDALDP